VSWKTPDADLVHNSTIIGGPKQRVESLISSWLDSLFYRHITVIIATVISVSLYCHHVLIAQIQIPSALILSNITSVFDGRCTCEIKSRIAMAKVAFNKKRVLFTSTLDLKLRKKLVKCYIWSIALYDAGT
jgi:hypothetical protein